MSTSACQYSQVIWRAPSSMSMSLSSAIIMHTHQMYINAYITWAQTEGSNHHACVWFWLVVHSTSQKPKSSKIIMWIKKRESKYKCSHFRISSSHVRLLYAILLYKNALGRVAFSLCVSFALSLIFSTLSVYQTHGPNFSLPSSHLAVCVRNGCRLHIYTYARRHAFVHFKRVIVHTSSAMAFSLFGNLEFYPKRSKNRRKWLTTNSTTSKHTHTCCYFTELDRKCWRGKSGVHQTFILLK